MNSNDDKFRVFYDVEEVVRIVAIEAIAEKKGDSLFFQGEERELLSFDELISEKVS